MHVILLCCVGVVTNVYTRVILLLCIFYENLYYYTRMTYVRAGGSGGVGGGGFRGSRHGVGGSDGVRVSPLKGQNGRARRRAAAGRIFSMPRRPV